MYKSEDDAIDFDSVLGTNPRTPKFENDDDHDAEGGYHLRIRYP